MTSMPPDDADRTDADPTAADRTDPDRTGEERSAAEVDAEFAAIIAGISQEMTWNTSAAAVDADAAAAAAVDLDAGQVPSAAALERDRRRALRRAQRAEEVALFEAAQAASAAELQADEAHFVPPEPPPVPRPRRRTLVALLLMSAGLVMLLRPGLLQVAPDAVLVLGIGLLIGGFGMLVYGLRPRASDPGDADGWDDGARL